MKKVVPKLCAPDENSKTKDYIFICSDDSLAFRPLSSEPLLAVFALFIFPALLLTSPSQSLSILLFNKLAVAYLTL